MLTSDGKCESLDVLTKRFIGVPLTSLSSMLLLQLANRISMASQGWVKKNYIALQGEQVTLSATPFFEMANVLCFFFH